MAHPPAESVHAATRQSGRHVVRAMMRGLLVAAAAAALATISLGAAVLALTGGSALVLAWVYRKPWPVGWLTALPPALAGIVSVLAQLALPIPDRGIVLALGGGAGGIVGAVLGLRHRADRAGRTLAAGPAWVPILLWCAGVLAGQATALTGDREMAGYGVLASTFGSVLVAAFFLGLLARKPSARSSVSRAGLVPVLLFLAPFGRGLDAQTGLRPGEWTGSLDPERRAAAIARITFAEVSYECSDVSARVRRDGGVEIEGGFSCSIVFTDNRPSGEILSSISSYRTRYTPMGPGSTGAIPMSVDVVRESRFILSGGRNPRVTETTSHYDRSARLEGTPDGDGLWLYVYNGADAIAIVPWRLRNVEPALEPSTPAEPGPVPVAVPGTDSDATADSTRGYDPDLVPPPVPASYVPRHLLVEAGEQTGVLVGLAALLAGIVSSLALGLGATVAGATPPEVGAESGSGPTPGTGDPNRILQAIRQQRIEWLASGGNLPEVVGAPRLPSPWAGEASQSMRDAVETVDRAVRDPDDIYDPTDTKSAEMEEVRRAGIVRQGNRVLRMLRALVAGGGDVAADPSPGLRTAATGVTHGLIDFFGPDPTSVPENMVDPQSEYRDLLDAWRSKQSTWRWIRTSDPREPADIERLIRDLRDERFADQMAHKGDDAYNDAADRQWEGELRALRAMQDWLGRAGGGQ